MVLVDYFVYWITLSVNNLTGDVFMPRVARKESSTGVYENMEYKEIVKIVNEQKEYFNNGKTLDIEFRLAELKRLKSAIIGNEQEILNALKQDLYKPLIESYTSEIGLIIREINTAIKNLKKWAKPEKIKSTFLTFPSKNYIMAEPFGVSLIISPWNYPFQLSLVPLVGAIAAGNCCIIKPSEYSVASIDVIKKLINNTFDSNYIFVIDGDSEVSKYLFEQPFDKIFFTGSPEIGKIVMERAAKHLTSVTLELGGKSPCVVDKNINIDITAKRILWGKFMNAGQTCIAPDYLIVHKDIKEQLYIALKKWITVFFSENPQNSPDFGRIINKKHFDRLKNYLVESKIIFGGSSNEQKLYIEPSIIEIDDLNSPIMQEEIFGPILPVVVYHKPQDIKEIIARNPNPLGFYLFSTDKMLMKQLIHGIPFGGGCINDVISHVTNHNLPFGGRGTSGIGSYHGRYSFDAFSHKKSVLQNGFIFDMSMKYPPYKDIHTHIRKFIMK